MKKADIERMKEALRESCYRPGNCEQTRHILYCHWCHYSEAYPHHPDCVMSLVGSRAPKPQPCKDDSKEE